MNGTTTYKGLPSAAAAYSIAAAAVVVATAARWLLDPLIGDHFPFITFFLAVVVAAWYGGLSPALAAIALGFGLAWYIFIPVHYSFSLVSGADLAGLAVYLVVSLAIAGFSGAMHTAQRRSLEAEQLAHQRAETLRVTLASIGDAVVTSDTRGRVTYMNAAAETLTGWTQTEASGRPLEVVFRIVNEQTRETVENPAVRALRDGVIVGLANHTILIRKDGTEVPIDDSASPIRDEQGHLAGCVLVFRDITDRRRAAEALTRLAAIVEASDDAIISKTLEGTILSWNAGAERLFGYTAAEAVGRPITLIIPPELRDEERSILERLRQGERLEHYETVRISKQGRRIDISLTVSPVRDGAGRLVGASKVARDITDRKQAEEALRSSDRCKDEFLATLAHELRNPLAPIRNALEIAKRTDADRDTVQHAHGTIERQIDHMVRLVDDLMDVSRITRDELDLRKEQVELASIVHHAVETCRPLAQRASQTLEVALPEQPIYLHADPVRLAQALSNLLNNASKYTGQHGTIRFTAEHRGDHVLVSVQDSGIGIPPDKLEAIFEMFAQVDKTLEQSRGGLGIGLTLARRLVELHGGSITARSKGLGLGSEFVLRLPALAAQTHDRSSRVSRAEAPALASLRILVVDDNQDGAVTLATLLQLTGHETRVAHDGWEALEAVERFRPDVVLLDIGLPGLNGIDVCRRIRQAPWGRSIVLVALTGWGQDEDRRRSKRAGFDWHLVKPVDQLELDQLLRSLPNRPPSAKSAS